MNSLLVEFARLSPLMVWAAVVAALRWPLPSSWSGLRSAYSRR
jgi:hypothetical protein